MEGSSEEDTSEEGSSSEGTVEGVVGLEGSFESVPFSSFSVSMPAVPPSGSLGDSTLSSEVFCEFSMLSSVEGILLCVEGVSCVFAVSNVSAISVDCCADTITRPLPAMENISANASKNAAAFFTFLRIFPFSILFLK
ncbi:MAG TPA: hypothetical protein H9744_02470 [Candidatus Eisenbergiella stercoravium]|nr:hypothetical protein [Candidatus Eisenbergiella stercoravium]